LCMTSRKLMAMRLCCLGSWIDPSGQPSARAAAVDRILLEEAAGFKTRTAVVQNVLQNNVLTSCTTTHTVSKQEEHVRRLLEATASKQCVVSVQLERRCCALLSYLAQLQLLCLPLSTAVDRQVKRRPGLELGSRALSTDLQERVASISPALPAGSLGTALPMLA
jgi:hypothetical protein